MNTSRKSRLACNFSASSCLGNSQELEKDLPPTATDDLDLDGTVTRQKPLQASETSSKCENGQWDMEYGHGKGNRITDETDALLFENNINMEGVDIGSSEPAHSPTASAFGDTRSSDQREGSASKRWATWTREEATANDTRKDRQNELQDHHRLRVSKTESDPNVVSHDTGEYIGCEQNVPRKSSCKLTENGKFVPLSNDWFTNVCDGKDYETSVPLVQHEDYYHRSYQNRKLFLEEPSLSEKEKPQGQYKDAKSPFDVVDLFKEFRLEKFDPTGNKEYHSYNSSDSLFGSFENNQDGGNSEVPRAKLNDMKRVLTDSKNAIQQGTQFDFNRPYTSFQRQILDTSGHPGGQKSTMQMHGESTSTQDDGELTSGWKDEHLASEWGGGELTSAWKDEHLASGWGVGQLTSAQSGHLTSEQKNEKFKMSRTKLLDEHQQTPPTAELKFNTLQNDAERNLCNVSNSNTSDILNEERDGGGNTANSNFELLTPLMASSDKANPGPSSSIQKLKTFPSVPSLESMTDDSNSSLQQETVFKKTSDSQTEDFFLKPETESGFPNIEDFDGDGYISHPSARASSRDVSFALSQFSSSSFSSRGHARGPGSVIVEDLPENEIRSMVLTQGLILQGDDARVKTSRIKRAKCSGGGMDVDVANSRDVMIVKNFQHNTQVVKLPDDIIKNVRSQTGLELGKTQDLFVETSDYHNATKILEKKHMVFLTGLPSVGKRILACALLRDFQEKNFEPLILRNVNEIRNMANPKVKQALYLPNMFGLFEFDEKRFDEWVEYFRNFSFDGECTKFIFSSRNGIFKKGYMSLSSDGIILRDSIVELASQGNLSIPLMRKLLQNHLIKRGMKISEELVEKIVFECEGTHLFPKCCDMFSENSDLHNINRAIAFFKKPILYYRRLVECLRQRSNNMPYAVLCLLMLLGKLSQSFFHEVPENDDVFTLLSILGIDLMRPESKAVLKEAAQGIMGTFLKESEGSLIFVDDCVYVAVALVFGEQHPRELLQICSTEFIMENVHMAVEQAKDVHVQIILDKDKYDYLSERIVNEIRKGNCSLVSLHIAFTHWDFIKPFVSYCKKQDDFRDLLQSKDKQFGKSWLYWSSWNKKEHLCKWILSELKTLKNGISKPDLPILVKSCCVSNNLEILKVILKLFKKGSDMLKSSKKEAIFLPPTMATIDNDEEIGQNGGIVQVENVLHTACMFGHLSFVQFLIDDCRFPMDSEDSFGRHPINIAAINGYVEILKFLMNRGVKINKVSWNKSTVMHDACKAGQTEVVKFLIENCPRLVTIPDSSNEERYPIHQATCKEANLVKVLLSAGARPDDMDIHGNTAFHTACMKKGNLQVLKELKPSPNQVNQKNRNKMTCLHLACRYAGTPVVMFLIQAGADVNAKDSKRQTPLHVACDSNQLQVVKKLLEVKETDLFVVDITGKAALHLTKNKEIQELVKNHMIQHTQLENE